MPTKANETTRRIVEHDLMMIGKRGREIWRITNNRPSRVEMSRQG